MSAPTSLNFLNQLESVIDSRRKSNSGDSYTASLFAAGRSRIAQKLGEEGVELALASVQGDVNEIRSEAADLVFHLLVLLREHDLTLADVVGELDSRHR